MNPITSTKFLFRAIWDDRFCRLILRVLVLVAAIKLVFLMFGIELNIDINIEI